jgi:hypothetical protein
MGQNGIMVTAYQTDEHSFRAERPRRWYPTLVQATRPVKPYDVHPDGNRIAVAKPPDVVESQKRPVCVFNFFDELRRTVK